MRKRRLDLGLLQREVAQRFEVHEASVYNWENNRTSPSLRFIPRIIEFLGYVPHDVSARTLAQRIVASRRLLGLTQKELAQRLSIHPSTLGRWERDERRRSKELLERLNALPRSLPPDIDRDLF